MSNYYHKWRKTLHGFVPLGIHEYDSRISAFVCRCDCSKNIEWFETVRESIRRLEQHRTHAGQDVGVRVAGDILPPTEDTENLFTLFPENRYPVPDDRFVFVRTKLEEKIEILQQFAKLTVTPKETEIAQRKIHYLRKWLKVLNQQIRKGSNKERRAVNQSSNP